ncbi:bifunctional precorrin-2 dehydrogenase/sirohydrochlorin ferrochelatase [Psychrobacillus sp. OK032]|uniref:precorrin-2 dehydrogenase/sirohydrochlorin ferrochelatase family protein n=1 Tax=Psychrobacillus sp. OK032 TaxID=1884358 RepID=UPI0008B98B3C|nr:NAD(P)-dependent oxidoreductase [Psychrobacillus sp. OK032]SES35131.1 precorrin-2 dehydrogenase / sirohydrochlorin ferrochelatase [Psychrobacillus sp. OK032]
MNYFPLLLNIEYKTVVIIGGGHVARQKVEALLPTKAKIVVISPTITEELLHYVENHEVTWKMKEFEPADLDDAALVFAVTNSQVVNDAVEEATQHWQLLSRADVKGRVDFINPAVLRRGDFILTVSTSGASPRLTRQVKAELAEQYGDYYEQYVAFLGQARQQILATFEGKVKNQLLIDLLEPQLLEWIKDGRLDNCDQWLQQRLGDYL